VCLQTTKKIRVLIADDHLVFRMGLRALLTSEPNMEVVADAASVEQAVSDFVKLRPDVVVLDLRMPEGGGLAALKAIRAESKHARVLVLSSYAFEEEVFQVLNAGASGYVLKDVGREELVKAIQEVARGKKWIQPTIESLVVGRHERQELTAREVEVLNLLVKGLLNREIANVLGVSENTVRNHTISIFNKLEVSDRAEAVGVALQRGIIIANT